MTSRSDQRRFWHREASKATFSHPLNQGWLEQVVQPEGSILDYGCGYGRTIAELQKLGYSNLTGLDTSSGMLDRAAAVVPSVRLVLGNGVPSPLPDAAFDLVLLFAVLTSIPENDRQIALIEDACRVLRPGGYLYVSDLPLQSDERRVARYQAARPEGLPYGAFEIDGGRAVMRHHSEEWFKELFASFHIVQREAVSVPTMRGRTASVVQFLLQQDRS